MCNKAVSLVGQSTSVVDNNMSAPVQSPMSCKITGTGCYGLAARGEARRMSSRDEKSN